MPRFFFHGMKKKLIWFSIEWSLCNYPTIQVIENEEKILQRLGREKKRCKGKEEEELRNCGWDIKSQFHQRSMCSFYVRKLCTRIFCAYILGLYSTGTKLLAQKMRVERWWNWALGSISPTLWSKAQMR